jgi:hypothetical protein
MEIWTLYFINNAENINPTSIFPFGDHLLFLSASGSKSTKVQFKALASLLSTSIDTFSALPPSTLLIIDWVTPERFSSSFWIKPSSSRLRFIMSPICIGFPTLSETRHYMNIFIKKTKKAAEAALISRPDDVKLLSSG